MTTLEAMDYELKETQEKQYKCLLESCRVKPHKRHEYSILTKYAKEIREGIDFLNKLKRSSFVFIIMLMCNIAGASEIPHSDMIKAIIGESANQSIKAQSAVACGILNRLEGLQGVYGKNISRRIAPIERSNAETALDMATPAYCFDLIQGSDMFCSDPAICRKPWRNVAMVFIIKIDDFYFYRRLTDGKN